MACCTVTGSSKASARTTAASSSSSATSSYRRVTPQSLSPSIKSLNYLNNIMAKVEANQYGADEALMLDIHGYVSEASAENVFIVRNHTLVTPFTSTNLPGVTREAVLEIAPKLSLEAKEHLPRYGFAAPRGVVAPRPDAIVAPPLPCMVKAQVLVGGRGKAGGIRPANTLDEARTVAGEILGMNIGGYTVKQVYLEQRLDIGRELYLSYTIDRSAREALLIASALGGVEIEAVPHDQIFMEQVPVLVGPQPYIWRALLRKLALPKEIGDQIVDIAWNADNLFCKE